MAKRILTLNDLGQEGAWLLVQQACGIPDPRARSNFMDNTTAVLFFAQDSLPERLCITAAVRQMGGHVVYVGPGAWCEEVASYPEELNAIANTYMDVIYCYGFPFSLMRKDANPARPFLNGGSPESHPIHALADIACIYHYMPNLSEVTMSWVGCANGTLGSLIEGTEYFPYNLRVALPPDSIVPESLRKAQAEGRKVTLVDTPEEAVRDAHYVCAGCIGDKKDASANWIISSDLLRHANEKVRIMLSASPLCSTPIERDVLRSKASLLERQGENRLRVSKRILHLLLG